MKETTPESQNSSNDQLMLGTKQLLKSYSKMTWIMEAKKQKPARDVTKMNDTKIH